MAQLKDTVVQGSLRATDSLLATTLQFNILKIPNSSGGSTYTVGGNNNVLMSNGTTVYWKNIGDALNTGSFLLKTGDSMTGQLTVKNLYGTKEASGVVGTYGETLPSTNLTNGRIFFQITDPYYEIPTGGTTGQALVKRSNANHDVTWGEVGGNITLMANNSLTIYPCGISDAPTTAQQVSSLYCCTTVCIDNTVLYGACWNDYAEYRETAETIEPGRCIVENGDGTLSLSTQRLQAGAEIVSDTFGFAIGRTTQCNTPVATSGRVLAYVNEPRSLLKIGAPVSSGPNGTVSQMSKREASLYPWLIIGTISAFPEETTWGENNVLVNNRIWIRVR